MSQLNFLALIIAVVLSFRASAESQGCKPVTKATATSEEATLLSSFNYVYTCEDGVPMSQVEYLWSALQTRVDCGNVPLTVFSASTPEELKLRLLNGSNDIIRCRSSKGACGFEQSPFSTDKYLAVQLKCTWGSCRGASICKVHTQHVTQYYMGSCMVLGAVFVLFAAAWSTSLALRLIAAALLSATLSVVLAVYIVCKFVTGNRGIASVSSVISGLVVTSMLTILFPTVESAIFSPFVWAYIVGWGATGATVVYVSGAGMGNPRIGHVIRIAFQALGLVLVYGGSWTHTPVFAVLATLSVTYWTQPLSFWYPWNWVCWSQSKHYYNEKSVMEREEQKSRCGHHGQKLAAPPQLTRPSPPKTHEQAKMGFYMGPNGLIHLAHPEFEALCKKGYQPNPLTAQMEWADSVLL